MLVGRWVGQLTLHAASELPAHYHQLVFPSPLQTQFVTKIQEQEVKRSQKNGHYSEYASPTHPTKNENACRLSKIK
jgi:hypothetical protein